MASPSSDINPTEAEADPQQHEAAARILRRPGDPGVASGSEMNPDEVLDPTILALINGILALDMEDEDAAHDHAKTLAILVKNICPDETKLRYSTFLFHI